MEMNLVINPKTILSKLTFNDDHTVELDQNQILVIVGPNNAGKSASIREIHNYITNVNPYSQRKIIKNIDLLKIGDTEDLIKYIRDNTYIDPVNQYPAYHYLSEHVQQMSNQGFTQTSKFHIDLRACWGIMFGSLA